ncbi:methyltransferase [Paraoerskovia sediminicola]|uniref:Methyltransferase n=1 Tax=Paraoerskovia sediminicola TaxID=1138587 RepID=A0ABM8G695_9CELL|nr:transcription antitermination factor NusB [Paraoerskovia sediminicola]BDZ43657.1 methyltransferase [Paraoerskovia sediminicola]
MSGQNDRNSDRRNDRASDRRDGRGRQRGAARSQGSGHRSAAAPSQRRRGSDPARAVAYDVLRQVDGSDAYANLVLPPMLRSRSITGRDAGFATELAYGTLRMRGRHDAVIARCVDRHLDKIDPPVLDLLRLGTHQLTAMRVPNHAAVSETVGLAREKVGAGAAQFVNAVLRSVARTPVDEWLLAVGDAARATGGEDERLSVLESHPRWITRALRESLVAAGRPAEETEDLLRADNAAPRVTLVVRPGLPVERELAEIGGPKADRTPGTSGDGAPRSAPDGPSGPAGARRSPRTAAVVSTAAGRWAPTARVLEGGDPGALTGVREGSIGVQDEGSQLVTLAFLAAEIEGPDERWLDLCAGPGGKAALLAAVAGERGARVVANEVQPHRTDLVHRALSAVMADAVEDVRTGDGRAAGTTEPGAYDRVLLDAPCTGLGALRRRPESRWRRTPSDVGTLTALQGELLRSALAAVRPGGMVGYVTCSPHLAETRFVVDDVLRGRDDVERVDAAAAVRQVVREAGGEEIELSDRSDVQLWPHLHGTDAMHLTLLRRR